MARLPDQTSPTSATSSIPLRHARKTGERRSSALPPRSRADRHPHPPGTRARAERGRALQRIEDGGLELVAGLDLPASAAICWSCPPAAGLPGSCFPDCRGSGVPRQPRLRTPRNPSPPDLAQMDEPAGEETDRNCIAFVTAYLQAGAGGRSRPGDRRRGARGVLERLDVRADPRSGPQSGSRPTCSTAACSTTGAGRLADEARSNMHPPAARRPLPGRRRAQGPAARRPSGPPGPVVRLTQLPPVADDEPLVRDYLLHFFVEAADFDAYTPWIRDDFLKPLFAEAMITAGAGDPQQWPRPLPGRVPATGKSAWTSISRPAILLSRRGRRGETDGLREERLP